MLEEGKYTTENRIKLIRCTLVLSPLCMFVKVDGVSLHFSTPETNIKCKRVTTEKKEMKTVIGLNYKTLGY